MDGEKKEKKKLKVGGKAFHMDEVAPQAPQAPAPANTKHDEEKRKQAENYWDVEHPSSSNKQSSLHNLSKKSVPYTSQEPAQQPNTQVPNVMMMNPMMAAMNPMMMSMNPMMMNPQYAMMMQNPMMYQALAMQNQAYQQAQVQMPVSHATTTPAAPAEPQIDFNEEKFKEDPKKYLDQLAPEVRERMEMYMMSDKEEQEIMEMMNEFEDDMEAYDQPEEPEYDERCKDCKCCKGLVQSCHGKMCQYLGVCECRAHLDCEEERTEKFIEECKNCTCCKGYVYTCLGENCKTRKACICFEDDDEDGPSPTKTTKEPERKEAKAETPGGDHKQTASASDVKAK